MNRRAFLGGTSAGALLWAMGCHGRPSTAPLGGTGSEVRSWLRDAVTRMSAVYPTAHALATTRRRVTAAVDVVGEGVSRARVDSVVLTVRDDKGSWREHVTSDLSKAGIEAATTALVGKAPRPSKSVDFGSPDVSPGPLRDPSAEPDLTLVNQARQMLGIDERHRDPDLSSRIVYTSATLDVDDARVWSVAPGRDREQRLVRVRRSVSRVAWNGTRPIVSEAARGWIGELDDDTLTDDAVRRATRGALRLMTQGAFAGGDLALALDPSVTSLVIGNATRALLTTDVRVLPEVAQRLAAGPTVASPALTLIDDPTVAGAYGGFRFDDEGELAAPITLLDHGRVVGQLGDRASGVGGRGRRPGHVGRVAPSPSHLRLEPGTRPLGELIAEGFRLEGGIDAVIDPSSDRITVSVARAVEIKKGHETGRVYADVELVGDLAQLLAQVTDVAAELETFPLRDEIDGQPRWQSIEAPGVATRGLVRARRRMI